MIRTMTSVVEPTRGTCRASHLYVPPDSMSSALSMKGCQIASLHNGTRPRPRQSEEPAGLEKRRRMPLVSNRGLVRGILDRLQYWGAMYRERRELLALAQDETFLSDLGLSKSDALQEAQKPFWVE